MARGEPEARPLCYYKQNRKMHRTKLASLCLAVFAAFNLSCGGGNSPTTTNTNSGGPAMQLEVLSAPPSPFAGLATNTLVTGANFVVKWADIDKGPGATPRYVFTSTDAQFTNWINAGKKINLIVWPMTYVAPNDATPAYVLNNLGSANQTMCGLNGVNEEVTPNFFSEAFQQPYEEFIQALLQHYSSTATVNGTPGFGSPSAIGYIRIGLAQGGETYPALGFDGTDPVCTAAFANWGWNPTTWKAYLAQMLDYEKSLNVPIQLMVALNVEKYQGVWDYSIPETEAARAVANGIAIGNEGFTDKDIRNFDAGAHCSSDWCAQFAEYAGRVPMELQMGGGGKSDPTCDPGPCAGNGTGSLTQLLPFAAQRHTTIMEIDYSDWQIAFDPDNSYYAQYHVQYQQALQQAAQ